MKFGIAPRLALLLAAVAVLAAGVAGFQVYREARERLVAEAHQRLAASARLAARRLTAGLEATLRDLRVAAGSSEIKAVLARRRAVHGASDEHVAEWLQHLATLNPAYAELALVAADEFGSERMRIARNAENALLRVAEADLQEKGHLRYVRQGLAMPPGEVFAQPVTIRQGSGAQHGLGDPRLVLAIPVHGGRGETLGVIALSLRLPPLLEAMQGDLPAQHRLYLTNRDGDFLVHPDPEKAFAFERGRRARVQDEYPQTAALFSEPGGDTALVEAADGTANLAAFVAQRVHGGPPGSRFVVGLAQPAREVLVVSDGLTRMALRMLMVYSLVAIVLAVVVAGALTRPLRQMAAVAQRFAESSESEALPVERGDEIGLLARTLQQAQERVRHALQALEESRNDMMHLARHDPLTGLPNRLLFGERLERAIARANRTKALVALLLVDLDGFKPVNDHHGHAAGDALLRTLARRMAELVRETDTVARFGGDEFVVLLEGLEDRAVAAGVAAKLLDALAAPVIAGGAEVAVGASIGMHFYPDAGSSDSLILGADAAMYQAKAAGGRCWRRYENPA